MIQLEVTFLLRNTDLLCSYRTLIIQIEKGDGTNEEVVIVLHIPLCPMFKYI